MPEFYTVLGRVYAANRALALHEMAASYREPGAGHDEERARLFDAGADYIEGKPVAHELLPRVRRLVPDHLRCAAEELLRSEKPGPATDQAYADLRSTAAAIDRPGGDRPIPWPV